jgi:thioredoxin-dependent peroxiredoxin
MRLTTNHHAPDFSITDVFGTSIQLKQLRGQKIYLAFERNAGCPVCNLHVHELIKKASFFKMNNIKIILVYESTKTKMIEYLNEDSYPFHFVADPENKLYNIYGVERSYLKVLKSLFNGLIGKVMRGKKLFKKPMSQDGHTDRIPSEFLIDEQGIIKTARYGRFVGDHMEIDAIK